jgi:hypothetical protein
MCCSVCQRAMVEVKWVGKETRIVRFLTHTQHTLTHMHPMALPFLLSHLTRY